MSQSVNNDNILGNKMAHCEGAGAIQSTSPLIYYYSTYCYLTATSCGGSFGIETDSEVWDSIGLDSLLNSLENISSFSCEHEYHEVLHTPPFKSYWECANNILSANQSREVYVGAKYWENVPPVYDSAERWYWWWQFYGSFNLTAQNNTGAKFGLRTKMWSNAESFDFGSNDAHKVDYIPPNSSKAPSVPPCKIDELACTWADDFGPEYYVELDMNHGFTVETPLGIFSALTMPNVYYERLNGQEPQTLTRIQNTHQVRSSGFYGGLKLNNLGNPNPEISRRFLAKGYFAGVYNSKVMSQIYANQWTKTIITADGPATQTYTVSDREIVVMASSDIFEDASGEDTDPRGQIEDESLSEAIESLIEGWYTLNNAPKKFIAAAEITTQLLSGINVTSISSSSSSSSLSSSSSSSCSSSSSSSSLSSKSSSSCSSSSSSSCLSSSSSISSSSSSEKPVSFSSSSSKSSSSSSSFNPFA